MRHIVGITGALQTPDIQAKALQGFKHFELMSPVPAKRHDHGCARVRATIDVSEASGAGLPLGAGQESRYTAAEVVLV